MILFLFEKISLLKKKKKTNSIFSIRNHCKPISCNYTLIKQHETAGVSKSLNRIFLLVLTSGIEGLGKSTKKWISAGTNDPTDSHR